MLRKNRLEHIISTNETVLFVNGCGEGSMSSTNQLAINLANQFFINPCIIDLLRDSDLREQLYQFTNWKSTPQLFVKGIFLGGLFVIPELLRSEEYYRWIDSEPPGDLFPRLKSSLTRSRSPWKMSRYGDRLYLALASGALRCVSANDLSVVFEVQVCDGWLNAVECIAEGQALVGDTQGNVYLVSDVAPRTPTLLFEHDRWVNDIVHEPVTGAFYAIDGAGRLLRCSDVCQTAVPSVVWEGTAAGWSVCVSHDMDYVAIGLGDGHFQVLRRANHSLAYSARLHDGAITSIKATRDGFALCGYDGFLSHLSMRTFQLLRAQLHGDRVWDLSVGHAYVVSVGADDEMVLIDVAFERELDRIALSTRPVLVNIHNDQILVFDMQGNVNRFHVKGSCIEAD